MPARVVGILCVLVLCVQTLTAVASAGGLLWCVHADGTAHVCDGNDRVGDDASRSASPDATCSGRDVPLGTHHPKPAVARGPVDQAVAVDWTAERSPLVDRPHRHDGPTPLSSDDTPTPPQSARVGVVLLT